MPGGAQNLGETPQECAERECWEESGYRVQVTELLGVFSSKKYPYINYPWKENEICHLFFRAKIIDGTAKTSEESEAIGWFSESELPPLSDGHEIRIRFGFKKQRAPETPAYFE